MCQLTETYYTYCQHFGPRRPQQLCPRASASPSFVTTGCWYSTVNGTVTLFDICPKCRAFPSYSCPSAENSNSSPSSNDHFEGGESGMREGGFESGIVKRTMEERGPGKDQGIWLKSFGRRGDSTATSREGSRYGSPFASRYGSREGSVAGSTPASGQQSGYCSPRPEMGRKKTDPTSLLLPKVVDALHRVKFAREFLESSRKDSGVYLERDYE